MNGWRECRNAPCPICGHRGWCGVSEDGAAVHCMRTPSAHPCASGGWFHFLAERPRRATGQSWPVRPPRPVRPVLDMARTMEGFRREFECGPSGGDIFDSLLEIGRDLALVPRDVDSLRVGRSAYHGAWAFPMLDAAGQTVGIRLREYGSSRKWSVPGSRDGLFYDPELAADGGELVVVEGATDCIAATALGLSAVGRSSCGTGAPLLRELCDRLRVRRVTIVSDNDRHRFRPDGHPWRPGIDGARRLGAALGRAHRIVIPPCKDLRDWLAAGLTPATFRMVADLQRWITPERNSHQ